MVIPIRTKTYDITNKIGFVYFVVYFKRGFIIVIMKSLIYVIIDSSFLISMLNRM